MGDGPAVALVWRKRQRPTRDPRASTPSHTAAASRADDVPWFWRDARPVHAGDSDLLCRRDKHVGACACATSSTEPTAGLGAPSSPHQEREQRVSRRLPSRMSSRVSRR
jgi:hypothetical protein